MAMRWGQLYKGTPAEKSLEDSVAALGVPYRTQFPGYLFGVRYFVDFFLPTLGLVIEVDDDSHRRPVKVLADAERTEDLRRAWNVRVVRCTNDEALQDPSGTLKRLLAEANCWPLPSRRPSLAASLPQVKKAPMKVKRERAAESRKEKRQGSTRRRQSSDRPAPRDPPPHQEEAG